MKSGIRKMLACAAAAVVLAAPVNARDQHVLWTVAGRHNTVYLLGSIHLLRASDGGLPAAANDAYADAEQLVMEIDMDDPGAQPVALAGAMQQTAMLPPGQTLRSVLGADYPRIAAQTAESGIDLDTLDGFAPWFVALTVMTLELMQRGFDPSLGVEQTLANRAVSDRKPITGLETPQQQFAVLSGLPLAEQKRFLIMTLDEADRMDDELDDLLTAWRTGDTDALETLLAGEFERFPELYKPLTEDRNRAGLGRIEALLDGDRDDYLVVVGALHLVGRNSVVELLEARGYDVQQQ
jgi:uncharacterized protein YbaP (TraB family)